MNSRSCLNPKRQRLRVPSVSSGFLGGHEQRSWSNMEITGYFPGVIGKITELHAVYYNENWGFDASFEVQVGSELSDFISEYNEKRDGFWVGKIDGDFAGCVAIDGRQAESDGARLRWFIVTPRYHGKGFGGSLLREAVEFCREAGHKRVFLWTFDGLDAARTLYEREGFRLCEEHQVWQWGQKINEQMFNITL